MSQGHSIGRGEGKNSDIIDPPFIAEKRAWVAEDFYFEPFLEVFTKLQQVYPTLNRNLFMLKRD